MCAAWGVGRNPDGDLVLRGLPLLCGAERGAPTRFEASSLQVVEVTTVAKVEHVVELRWCVESVPCRGRGGAR